MKQTVRDEWNAEAQQWKTVPLGQPIPAYAPRAGAEGTETERAIREYERRLGRPLTTDEYRALAFRTTGETISLPRGSRLVERATGREIVPAAEPTRYVQSRVVTETSPDGGSQREVMIFYDRTTGEELRRESFGGWKPIRAAEADVWPKVQVFADHGIVTYDKDGSVLAFKSWGDIDPRQREEAKRYEDQILALERLAASAYGERKRQLEERITQLQERLAEIARGAPSRYRSPLVPPEMLEAPPASMTGGKKRMKAVGGRLVPVE